MPIGEPALLTGGRNHEAPRERGRPARTTLAQPHPTPPPGSTGSGARTLLRPSPGRSRRRGGRVPHRRETERHATGQHAGETPALPEGASSHPFCSKRRHCPCRCGRAVPLRVSSVKHPIVNKGEPPMNTNGHEDRWTCLAATTSREEATRERGRPARTTLAQPHPTPPPGSTGNGARTLLRPSPCLCRRQGDRAPHHGETERPPNPENAGETPALPEGRLLPSFLLREEALPLPMRQSRSASCAFVVLRVSSWIPLFSLVSDKIIRGKTPDRQ